MVVMGTKIISFIHSSELPSASFQKNSFFSITPTTVKVAPAISTVLPIGFSPPKS